MSTSVRGYAAPAASQPLQPAMITRRDVGVADVRIDIRYCGICHSDIHTVRDEWGTETYPLTPGHEIVGVVSAVGEQVTRWQVGDTVGVGCMVNTCRTCEACLAGEEQYCSELIWTYASRDRDTTITQGGYSAAIVVDQDFVVRIPPGMDLAATAPLLCAGVTMYSPLRHWGAGPGSEVAIVGLGGLGHVGVKIAAALGAQVSVLSQSLAKKADGLRFGAAQCLATNDPATLPSLKRRFDLILNTVSTDLDMAAYLATLKRDGTFVELGLPSNHLSVSSFSLIKSRARVSGSGIGSMAETQAMLNFCAEHGITAEIEVINPEQINEAYERIVNSQARYRYVIDASQF